MSWTPGSDLYVKAYVSWQLTNVVLLQNLWRKVYSYPLEGSIAALHTHGAVK